MKRADQARDLAVNETAGLAARWRALTAGMQDAQAEINRLGKERQLVTRELHALPGMTNRALGALLGVSNVTISNILHRGETRPGRLEET